MNRDKAMAVLVFGGIAWLISVVMLVVTFIEGLNDPDRWSGFVVMLTLVLMTSGINALALHRYRQSRP